MFHKSRLLTAWNQIMQIRKFIPLKCLISCIAKYHFYPNVSLSSLKTAAQINK